MVMGLINVGVFLAVLLFGFILGYKDAMEVFHPVLDEIGKILDEITREEENDNEMSVSENNKSVC